MTMLLDPLFSILWTPGFPPLGAPPHHPVAVFVQSLGRALDAVFEVPAWSMTPSEQRDSVIARQRQQAPLAELELRVPAAADPMDVGQERAAVVVQAVEALTGELDELPEATRSAAEAHLLDLARGSTREPSGRLGKRLCEVVCPEAADEVEGRTLAQQEERARRSAYLPVRDNGDGTCEGRFRLPTPHADLLKKARLQHATLLGHDWRSGCPPRTSASRLTGCTADVPRATATDRRSGRRRTTRTLGVAAAGPT